MKCLSYSRIELALVSTCLFVALQASSAVAAANPTLGCMPMKYRDTAGGGNQQFNLVFGNVVYKVDNTGWCAENHRTAENNKYDHMHLPAGIPFMDTDRDPDVPVSKPMVNYYYNAYYSALNAGWTPSGSPTCTHNCHGYAMGLTDPLIMSTANGVGKYLPDDGYQLIGEATNNCIYSAANYSHSYKITDVWDCPLDRVKTRSEKTDSSAFYTITFPSPGELIFADIYAK